jgi:mono/diheme cytochrome c family protein
VRLRFRLALLLSSLALAGCGESGVFGPMKMRYVESERLGSDDFKDKPVLQQKVRDRMAELFGSDPLDIRVPAGSGIHEGGVYLAKYKREGKGSDEVVRPIHVTRRAADGTIVEEPIEGGYGLYRKHCLHCHGVSGAGDGPTAPFLYPRPRDYRKGIFKFTSTAPTNARPTRSDLRKTISQGLHGTSMPAFDALMNDPETEQVIDYVVFLSMRGEVENTLIEEALIADEKDKDALSAESVAEPVAAVFKKWKDAETQVLNPPIPRVAATRESVLRGRALFLRLNKTGNQVDCTSCHGAQAVGDGPSFVGQDVFNHVVFGGDPSLMPERLKAYDKTTRELWEKSLDDWGNPLRPNNLNRGVYKGGRRPIDIYWRIAKGINGAKMPNHAQVIEPEKIWDLVNFVLALPYEPKLLQGAVLPVGPAAPAAKPAVATR